MENTDYSEQRIYEKARKKVREIRSFYINLMCYCAVIPTLAVINLVFSPEILWFLFSALGWGIGLTFHGMGAFDYNPILSKDWEEKKIKELLEKDKHNNKDGTIQH